MAPAHPCMTHIHITYHVLASLVYTLCDTHHTNTRGTVTKTVCYDTAAPVMQSVATINSDVNHGI